MSAPLSDPALVALHHRIAAIEGDYTAPNVVLPFGMADLDRRLPKGGLAVGCLHEVAGGGNGAVNGAAAACFSAGIAARLPDAPRLRHPGRTGLSALRPVRRSAAVPLDQARAATPTWITPSRRSGSRSSNTRATVETCPRPSAPSRWRRSLSHAPPMVKRSSASKIRTRARLSPRGSK